MDVDDLVVGSGLSALGAVCGLPPERKICVLAGQPGVAVTPYDAHSGIPCENTGVGGLGAFWHGVIPMTGPVPLRAEEQQAFIDLFARFYPKVPIADHIGRDRLFVPYAPIRPAAQWARLVSERGGALVMREELVTRVTREQGMWIASTATGTVRARRIWMAAGALGTPRILQQSEGFETCVRSLVSDHVIVYLGQIDRRSHPDEPGPSLHRTATGVMVDFRTDPARQAVITTKPARFDYRRLDHGIEQRSVFGLPTIGVLNKVMRAGSPGLVAESLFNKFGLFPSARLLSVYAQLRVEDAYRRSGAEPGLTPVEGTVQRRTDQFRASIAWPALVPSRRADLFVRGIHLHHTVDLGATRPDGLHVVDASVLDSIGPEHHSFATMARAMALTRESA